MHARLNVVTLGVDDLDRSLRFYRDGLGWNPAVAMGDFVAFDLGGVLLALYPRDLLAKEAGVRLGRRGFSGVTLAQNVASADEVDRALASAEAAGAMLLSRAAQKEWGGYSGYFADPDGHAWEIAWNPHWKLDDHGRVQL